MSGEIKKLASESALYGLGTMLPRMINFFLVPIQTRAFPSEDYGAISELYGYVAFLNIIFLFGMETAFFRFSNKDSNPDRVYRITQTIVLLISLVITVVLLITSSSITDLLHIPNKRVVIWLALILLVDAVVAIPFAQLRLRKKSLQFAAFKISNIVLLVGLNLFFIWYYGKAIEIEYVFIANFFANAVYLLFFIKDLISWRPLFDKQLTPEIFKYSYPLVIMGIAGTTNEMFSRISLDNWLPKDFYPGQTSKQVQGIFAGCYKFSVFMSLAVQAFRFAAEPFFFSKSSDKNSPALFAKINHYFILFACIFMIGICFNLTWLKYLVDEEYWSGLTIVPILLLGYLFAGVYFNMTVWFKVTDKTHYGTLFTVLGALITLAANFLLIPVYGIIGSSIATILCYFSMTLICYWVGQKNYPIPYSIGKDFLIITATCILVLLNFKFKIENEWLSIGLRGFASLLIALGAFLVVRKNLSTR